MVKWVWFSSPFFKCCCLTTGETQRKKALRFIYQMTERRVITLLHNAKLCHLLHLKISDECSDAILSQWFMRFLISHSWQHTQWTMLKYYRDDWDVYKYLEFPASKFRSMLWWTIDYCLRKEKRSALLTLGGKIAIPLTARRGRQSYPERHSVDVCWCWSKTEALLYLWWLWSC